MEEISGNKYHLYLDAGKGFIREMFISFVQKGYVVKKLPYSVKLILQRSENQHKFYHKII